MVERLEHAAKCPVQFAFRMGDCDPAVARMLVLTGSWVRQVPMPLRKSLRLPQLEGKSKIANFRLFDDRYGLKKRHVGGVVGEPPLCQGNKSLRPQLKYVHPHEAGFPTSGRAGSSIWKVEPSPNVDLNPDASAVHPICLAMASPRSVPPLAFS